MPPSSPVQDRWSPPWLHYLITGLEKRLYTLRLWAHHRLHTLLERLRSWQQQRRTRHQLDPWDHRTTVIQLSAFAQDRFSLGNLFGGSISLMGSPGSGKSSFANIALAALMDLGAGGIVTTVTNSDIANYTRLARHTGRENSLYIFGPDQPWRYNFLEHFWQTSEGQHVENILELFLTLLEVTDRMQQGGTDSAFWDSQRRRLLRALISIDSQANHSVSLPRLYRILSSLPATPTEAESNPFWREQSYCYQLIKQLDNTPMSASQQQDYQINREFLLYKFPGIALKTKSIIEASVLALWDLFLRAPLRELFCTTTNLSPQDTHEGAIVVIGMPTLVHHTMGKIVNTLWKIMWQKATQARPTGPQTRPVFSFQDEAHHHLVQQDFLFQTISRHSRAINVFITQSKANYEQVIGKDATDAFLASIQNHICFNTNCQTTSEYFSALIGKDWQQRSYTGLSTSGLGGAALTQGDNERFEYLCPPRTYSQLRKPAPPGHPYAEAVIVSSGRRWQHSGDTWMKVRLPQMLLNDEDEQDTRLAS